MRGFLIELIGISLPTSAVILLILAFSKRIKRSFSAACRYFIWLVIIIRLAIPFGGIFLPSLIEIPVYEAEYNEQENEKAPIDPPVSAPVSGEIQYTPETNTTPSPIVPDDPSGSTVEPEQITPQTGTVSQNTPAIEKEPEDDKGFEFDPSMIAPALFFLWAAGAVSFIASDLIKYNIYLVRTKKALVVPDEITISVYNEICSEMNIRKAPALYVSSVFQSPLLCGYFKKRIIIPNISLSDESLRRVLAHELTHHRRGDLWTKLLARFANAIHWFNPLAYVAVSRFYREMELSCDEKVISALSEEERILYGKTMLDIVKNCKNVESVLTTKFDPKKKAAGERIENIVGCEKKKRGIIIICTVVALCLIAGVVIGVNIISADNKKENKETTDKNSTENSRGDEYTLLISSSDGFSLYATEGADRYLGKNAELMLLVGKEKMFFKGSYGLYVSTKTKYCSSDVTDDGVSDHILMLSGDTVGEGACGEELHVFDGKTLKEIPCEDPSVIISERVVIKNTDNRNYIISIDGKENTYQGYYSIKSLKTPIIDKAHEYFTVDRNEITCNHLCISDEAHVNSYGIFKTKYIYSENRFVLDRTYYEEYRQQLYNNEIACETGNSNWKMSAFFDDNVIILKKGATEHRFELPVYMHDKVYYTPTIKPYAIIGNNEEYGAIVYIRDRKSNGYGCYEEAATSCIAVVDLKNDTVLDTIAFEKDDILKSHQVSEDTLAPYEYYITGDHSAISIVMNVSENKSGVLDMGILLITDDKAVKLSGSAQYDVQSRAVSKYKVGSKIIGELPKNTASSLGDLGKIQGLNENTVECVKAFLTKDITKLEELLGCREGVLRQYADFEFGETFFTKSEGNLKLEVDILESSLKTVPPGKYTFIFEDAIFSQVYVEGLHNYEISDENIPNGLGSEYVNLWLSYTGLWDFSNVETINNTNTDEFIFLKTRLTEYLSIYRSDMKTANDYRQAAKDIFGIENLNIPADMIDENGNIKPWGHGGFVRPCDILSETEENGIITVRLQAYADLQKTIKSHVYEYKFDNRGDYLKVIYSGIYEKSEYEPEDRFGM